MPIFCDILEPGTGEAYERDPRTTAKKAEAYVKSSGIGDTITVWPGSRVLHVRRRALCG
jgi:glutamine synthetase